MKRAVLLGCVALLAACNGEKLTGPAAQDAAAQHKSTAVAMARDIVFFLDGREISAEAFEKLDPKAISSVEVLKGAAAQRVLKRSDARAVILVESVGRHQ